jgi:hypothetical protein
MNSEEMKPKHIFNHYYFQVRARIIPMIRTKADTKGLDELPELRAGSHTNLCNDSEMKLSGVVVALERRVRRG